MLTHQAPARLLGLPRDPVPPLSRWTSVEAQQAALRHRRVVSIFRQVHDLAAAFVNLSSNIAATDCSKLAPEGVTRVWISHAQERVQQAYPSLNDLLHGVMITRRALLSAPRTSFRRKIYCQMPECPHPHTLALTRTDSRCSGTFRCT